MSSTKFRLDDRVAIITGGSKGPGKSIAQAFAEAGASIVPASRHRNECQTALNELRWLAGCNGLAIACDVTKEARVKKLFAAVMKPFGRADVLVNNAGNNIRHPIEEFPIADFRAVLDTNLTGAWLCCRAITPLFKKQRRGSCVNLASVIGHVGLPERSAYCAAKAGVVGLTRVMALEWAAFNARCPDPFATEINAPLGCSDKPGSGLANREASECSRAVSGGFIMPMKLGVRSLTCKPPNEKVTASE